MKNRFGWFYDREKYSIKELIVNYLMVIGFACCVLICVITGLVYKEYISDLISGKNPEKPWAYDRCFNLAFLFLLTSIVSFILKIWYIRKRKSQMIQQTNTLFKKRTNEKYYQIILWIILIIFVIALIVIIWL